MELILNKEPVCISEVIYDGQIEQGVEFDYVLPDYFPDIFKILKCTLTPAIISYSASGSQLFCDSVVYIKILYLAENSNNIHCIEQRYTYSKNIELVKAAENPIVSIIPKADYCNCRAISGRRIDVRGAVSSKVRVQCTRQSEIIVSAEGMGLQTKNRSVEYAGKRLTAVKQFILREDIETGTQKQGTISVVQSDAYATVNEYKVIADKIVIKGDVKVKALYFISDGEDEAEVMEAVVPVSQIIDVDGITDSHICNVTLSVMDCDLAVKSVEIGENRIFECDITVDCIVSANANERVMPVCDVYSTEYETTFVTSVIKTEASPRKISQQLALRTEIECGEGNIEKIYDARCELSNIICRTKSESELIITGQALMQVIGKLSSSAPMFIEKAETFELCAEIGAVPREYSIEPVLQVTSVTYSISGENKVDLRVQLCLNGMMYEIVSAEIVTDIVVSEDKPKQKNNDYALKLYYAEADEDVWNIAKRYSTDAESIMLENDLESEILGAAAMLLIPIV